MTVSALRAIRAFSVRSITMSVHQTPAHTAGAVAISSPLSHVTARPAIRVRAARRTSMSAALSPVATAAHAGTSSMASNARAPPDGPAPPAPNVRHPATIQQCTRLGEGADVCPVVRSVVCVQRCAIRVGVCTTVCVATATIRLTCARPSASAQPIGWVRAALSSTSASIALSRLRSSPPVRTLCSVCSAPFSSPAPPLSSPPYMRTHPREYLSVCVCAVCSLRQCHAPDRHSARSEQ
jgi:hypothetical protein